MAPVNRMSRLLDKLERRLGTAQLTLPEYLQKPHWASEVIENETLDTFSRYFPNALTVILDHSMQRRDGWYILDEVIDNSVEIIGVKDIDWGEFSKDALSRHATQGYGIYSVLPTDYSMDDVLAIQMRADMTSIFDNQVYVDFKAPNMVKLTSNYHNDVTRGMKSFPITVLTKHASNLMTINPTMMEIFEELAQADVASWLYENLKYFDGVESVYATTDLKMSDLQEKANKREDIVQRLDEAHVSFSNKNQPLIITV